MIGETRTEVLSRVGADLPPEQREGLQGIAGIMFRRALGDDDGQPLTAEDQWAVIAAFQEERNRIAVGAGYASVEEMEAAQ